MITNKRIGVLAGGKSAEREISLKSGTAIYNALVARGHNAVFIDVSKDICAQLTKEGVEIAFIALHGGYGENGALQGLLEVMEIPYTGSGILASALAMDKEATKKVFQHHGVPVAPYILIEKGEKSSFSFNALLSRAGFPLPWVVKPVAEGSSIGVSIVKQEHELPAALDAAFPYGDKIIIEQYIKGKEIQIGILDQTVLGGVEVRPSKEFYNYEAKYTPGATSYILPPEVDAQAYALLKETALRAHNALGCSGATRVDLILTEDGIAYVLEVNTIPGMTETSLLPKIAKLSGLTFQDLVEEIVSVAAKEKK